MLKPFKVPFDKKDGCRIVRLADLQEPVFPETIHKYERGYIGVIAGSKGLEGAAYLVAKAALKTGAGMVRLFADADFDLPLIEAVFSPQTFEAFQEYASKLDVIIIGPGLLASKTSLMEQIFQYLLDHPIPLIVDAGAIATYMKLKKKPFAILTPNGAEIKHIPEGAHPEFVLYKKGPPTWVYDPSEPEPYLIEEKEIRLATAGTGDVLSGMMGAYLARTGSYLQAALLASRRLLDHARHATDEFPTASDLI